MLDPKLWILIKIRVRGRSVRRSSREKRFLKSFEEKDLIFIINFRPVILERFPLLSRRTLFQTRRLRDSVGGFAECYGELCELLPVKSA